MGNQFKPFAIGENANVTSQSDWEKLDALSKGFQSGKASSAQVNKALRQATFISAALAQYTANKSGQDVLDDGDLNGFITKMTTAFGNDFQALDATLTALAGLSTGENKLPYFNGKDTAAQTDLTSAGRDLIGKLNVSDMLTYLGIPDLLSQKADVGGNQYTPFAVGGAFNAVHAVRLDQFQSGNNGNGAWTKLPGGGQWCRQNLNLAANSTTTWTFPASFPDVPAVFITAINGAFQCWINGVGASNCGIYNNGAALNVNLLALW